MVDRHHNLKCVHRGHRDHDLLAVILSGGRGERLRPYTDELPKPMVDVNGSPFLCYLFHSLIESGFSDFLMCVGYLGEYIKRYFGDGSAFSCHVRYSFDRQLLGTLGALRQARDLLEDKFLLLNGDTYVQYSYASLLKVMCDEPILMAVSSHPNLSKNALYSSGKIKSYSKEGGQSFNVADSGVYVLSKGVVDNGRHAKSSLEKDVFPTYASRGLIAGYLTKRRFYDIGTPVRLSEFRQYAKTRKLGHIKIGV